MYDNILLQEVHQWAEGERKSSAISPEVWGANVQLLWGWEAVQQFLAPSIALKQRVQNCVSAEGSRLQRRYAHLEDGCWMLWGEALVEDHLIPYAKPRRPRQGSDGKTIKYENPPGLQGPPVFPILPGRSWRDLLEDPSQPIGIVEGAKKAMSLISHGLPAVGLRGVTMWHAAGERDPWPELCQLAQGRPIYLFPDQDTKVKSRSDVLAQNLKLKRALERHGARVRVVLWDPDDGKGIDDVLAAAEDPRARLQELMRSAPDNLEREAMLARAKRILSQDGPRAMITQLGQHVGELGIPANTIFWLDAPMGSGKTTALGRVARDWIQERQGQVLVLSPLNSLGQQTAQRWGLPHVHDYSPEQARLLRADVTARGGVVACLNSAERIEAALNPERPLLVIIDEANQVLADAASGGTLRDKWSQKLAVVGGLLQRAISVVAAEAGIWETTVRLLTELKPGCHVVGYRLQRRDAPAWQVTNYLGQIGGLRAEVARRLLAQERLLLVTTSQREARRWHEWAYRHGIQAERIDSETSGQYGDFFRDPNAWLAHSQPQFLILSPSAKTGVSIEWEGFEAVVGIFPGLDTDTCLQLLGRYRPPVPRLVWRPEFVLPEADEDYNPQRVWAEIARELQVYGASLDSCGPWTRFYVAIGRRRWAQKVAARQSLVWALEAAGHAVADTEAEPDPAQQAEFKAIDQEMRETDAAVCAGIQLDPQQHTLEWARETLEGLDSSLKDRQTAKKVLLQREFPGVDWNDPAVWMAAVYEKKPLRRRVQRWVGSHFVKSRFARDTQTRQKLRADPCPAHLVNRELFDWTLAARLRPLLTQIIRSGQVHPTGEVEQKIVELVLDPVARREIRRYWRLEIHEGQSTTAIVNKILRKFGFEVVRQKILRLPGGQRGWIYRIEIPEFWVELAQAFERHLRAEGLEPNTEVWIPGPPPGNCRHPSASEGLATLYPNLGIP